MESEVCSATWRDKALQDRRQEFPNRRQSPRPGKRLASRGNASLPVATLMLMASGAIAYAAEMGLPATVTGQVDSIVKRQMSQAGIPGLSIAVVSDLKLQWSKGYGSADLENSVPATASTSYRLASITKTITATALMQLVEQGKFDLDAPIQRYVPSFPEKRWPVTARQLLGHVAGIRSYKSGEMESTRHYASLTEALAVFQNDPLEFEPGTRWLYSSEGYTILAAGVEGASGMNYFEYVRRHIFEPAGMESARPDSVTALIPHRTQGYIKLKGGELENSGLADTSSKAVVCTNVEDLARFAIALLSGKLVRPETLAEMFKIYPVTRRKAPVGFFGFSMGWNVAPREDNKELEVWKAGNQQRVTGLLYLRPERKCVVALLCNLENAPLTVKFAQEISNIVLGEQPQRH